ncbi:MAG: pseudouridine synthase [Myxococcales bacterium]|nr:pseudouridine synthase [Polyangiaceae bacterium]MDW8248766.1 pseudouridine synthase [Myxococcales bacterium]
MPEHASTALPCSMELRTLAGFPVLHEEDGWLALNKPSGLPVHRGYTGERQTLVDLLRHKLPSGAVHTVHRLDRGTSGVLLVATQIEMAQALQECFARREVRKVYLALARGVVPEEVEIDSPVPAGPEQQAPRVEARTRVRRLAFVQLEASPLQESRYSLILAEPETGRFHQVRRHLSHIAHPLIGDSNHGRPEHNRLLRARVGLSRLALHARELLLRHPLTGAPVRIRAPLPEDLTKPLQALGFDVNGLLQAAEDGIH